MQIHVDNGDIAGELRSDPAAALEVLGLIADGFKNEDGAREWAAQVAAEHSGSLMDQMVLPLLELLAEALRAEEALQEAG